MTIILMGYMGSGKSTVGEYLSKILKYNYVDLDSFIQKQEHATIPELFKNKGEIYFRNIERRYLNDVLSLDSTVISLGGGTPCYGMNMDAIINKQNVQSIYLKMSIPNLTKRLDKEKKDRPLISHLQSNDDLTEFIGKHLFERSFYYNQADKVIVVDDKSVKSITEEIISTLF